MTQDRKSAAPEARPFTARSVIASTLLGVEPPRLPSRQLVLAGELFGIAEGTIRVALSRMVADGELRAEDGWYRLVGPLLERQARQQEGRRPDLRPWDGRWVMAIVDLERRAAGARSELREAMRRLRFGELREGVWLRPDNLDVGRLPDAQRMLDAQCRRFLAELPEHDDPGLLAATLWDLDGWAAIADAYREALAPLTSRLEAGDTDALAPGFELSAAVLRHLLADPLLPTELLLRDWPGERLRSQYERTDAAFKALWREVFRDSDREEGRARVRR